MLFSQLPLLLLLHLAIPCAAAPLGAQSNLTSFQDLHATPSLSRPNLIESNASTHDSRQRVQYRVPGTETSLDITLGPAVPATQIETLIILAREWVIHNWPQDPDVEPPSPLTFHDHDLVLTFLHGVSARERLTFTVLENAIEGLDTVLLENEHTREAIFRIYDAGNFIGRGQLVTMDGDKVAAARREL